MGVCVWDGGCSILGRETARRLGRPSGSFRSGRLVMTPFLLIDFEMEVGYELLVTHATGP